MDPSKWFSISHDRNCSWSGVGNIETSEGARVIVSDRASAHCKFGGTAVRVSGVKYRGAAIEVEMSYVNSGARPARLQLRVDGGGHQLDARTFILLRGEGRLSFDVPIGKSVDDVTIGISSTGQSEVKAMGLRVKKVAVKRSDLDMPAKLVNEAADIIRSNASSAGKINWKSANAPRGAGMTLYKAHEEIRHLVGELGDGHSAFEPYYEAVEYDQSPGPKDKPEFKRLSRDTAYITMPGYRGAGEEVLQSFVKGYSKELERLGSDGVRKWVLDIRSNSGGNMWPMLRALKPLLGSGPIGGTVQESGELNPWTVGDSYYSGRDLSEDRVAVVLGRRTASSGEAVAIAFSGRSNTKYFGEITSGRTTANTTFDLSDGSRLHLTTSKFVDRNLKQFPDGIDPDVEVASSSSVQSATTWIEVEN